MGFKITRRPSDNTRHHTLQDETLGGQVNEVLRDLSLIEEEAATLGLMLNCHKSKLICDETLTRDEILSAQLLQWIAEEHPQ